MMPAVPLVSIVMPALNAERWIGEAIESCLQQTWPRVEVIVVDNGSDDHTLNIARSYPAQKVRALKCGRPGASSARNDGIAAAGGDFIQFLDADDLLDAHKIEIQMERLAVSPPGTIASGAWARFAKVPGDQQIVTEEVWRDLDPSTFLVESWCGGGMMPVFSWLTPREIIKEAGSWNEELSVNDDGEYFTRVLLASAGIVFCHGAKTYYRTTNDPSISKDKSRRGMISALRSIDLSCGNLLDRTASNEARLACACQYQRFVFDCYPAYPDLVRTAEQRADALGGGNLNCPGGPAFGILSSAVGWKFARLVQLMARRMWPLVGDSNRQLRKLA